MLLLVATFALAQAGTSKPQMTGPELILKMKTAVREASPVEGALTSTGPKGQKATLEFRAMYPKLFSGTMKMFGVETQMVWNSEGMHMYMPVSKEYQLQKRESGDMGLIGLESLFGEEEYFSEIGSPSNTAWQGRDVLSVPLVRTSGKMSRKVVMYIDPKTFLPAGYDEDDVRAGGISRSVYTKLQHAKLTAKDFAFRKPGVE